MRLSLPRLLVPLLVLLAPGAGAAQEPAPDEPRPTDLVERAAARLAQIDVTVTGPRGVIESLTADDFTLKVNLTRIEEFRVDRFCDPVEAPGAESPDAVADATADAPVAVRGATVLFYFDQPHLTLAGRQRSLDFAKQLVRELIADGAEAMVASNATRLAILQEPTSDADVLLDVLEKLEHDRTQWDFFATEERSRVARVVEVLNKDRDLQRAISMARSYQREEQWRTDKNLRRLALTLARLADLPPPKMVVYFADTIRSEPGAHYLSFFGDLVRRSSAELMEGELDVFAGRLAFDELVNEAAAQGIRFYPVQAEGLFSPFELDQLEPGALGLARTASSSSRTRFRAVQQTMGNLARETGGRAFVHGEPVKKIVERIERDLDCQYVLSFDPTGFATDAPLRIKAEVRREGVRSYSRGRLVVQSESARLTARLLSAFATEGKSDGLVEVYANVIPTGFENGRYHALLQISLPGATLPAARWELGASIIYRDKVRDEVSGHVSAGRPDVPLVLESEVRLRPGSHEIVAVAHETTSDLVLSDRIRVDWPDPDEQRATAGPIAMLQPVDGAFARGDDTRTSGSLAQAGGAPLRTDRPTALTSLVCRGRRGKGNLRVERALVGSSEVDFPDLEFELDDERCVQVRDLIPADLLSPGAYRYVVRVLGGRDVLDERSRDVVTAAP